MESVAEITLEEESLDPQGGRYGELSNELSKPPSHPFDIQRSGEVSVFSPRDATLQRKFLPPSLVSIEKITGPDKDSHYSRSILRKRHGHANHQSVDWTQNSYKTNGLDSPNFA